MRIMKPMVAAKLKVLTALDASVLARIAGNPELARPKRAALLEKLSPRAQEVANVLFDENEQASSEAREAAVAIRKWTGRQPNAFTPRSGRTR